MSNELMDLSFSKEKKEVVLDRIDRLLAHVVNHFRSEEKELYFIGYPELEHHAELHAGLVSDALALRDQVAADGVDPSALFAFLVGKVIMGHLLVADVLFFPYFRSAEKREVK